MHTVAILLYGRMQGVCKLMLEILHSSCAYRCETDGSKHLNDAPSSLSSHATDHSVNIMSNLHNQRNMRWSSPAANMQLDSLPGTALSLEAKSAGHAKISCRFAAD